MQKCAAVHSSVHNHFKQERRLYSRDNFKLKRAAALAEWHGFGAEQGTVSLSKQRLVRIGPAAPDCAYGADLRAELEGKDAANDVDVVKPAL